MDKNKEEGKCCEKCLECPDYHKHDYCHNKTCECHTSPQSPVSEFKRIKVKTKSENLSGMEIKPVSEERRRIGMLCQWLNEDRITDPKKMVTNEELEVWLSDNKREVFSSSEEWEVEWHKFWNEKSKYTEQKWLSPDTHGIIKDFIRKQCQEAQRELVEEIFKLPKYKSNSKAIPKDDIVIQYSAIKGLLPKITE